MLYFARWKVILILVAALAGIVFAMPNVVPKSTLDGLPDWLPKDRINLGLDLRGGAHIAFEADMESLFKRRMETRRADIRNVLRPRDTGQTRIAYRNLRVVGHDRVTVRITDEADMAEALKRVRSLQEAVGGGVVGFGGLGGQPDTEVATGEDGLITVTMTDAAKEEVRNQTFSQAIEVVRRRLDPEGVKEPLIQRQGADRIIVQMAGVTDTTEIVQMVNQGGAMAFHKVEGYATPAQLESGTAPLGTFILGSDEPGEPPLILNKEEIVTGECLTHSQPATDPQAGGWVVTMRFNTRCAKRWGDWTTENVKQQFAIVLDNEVISAPVVQEPILGGSGQISGRFNAESANKLSILLRAGALPVKLEKREERVVDPSLGKDSIEAGEFAAALGFIAVVAYIFISYGLFGIFANIALIINVILIAGALSLLQATLTLPGIAGIVLTIGMAVDANVLIFERIREEMAAGKTPLNAVEAGYQRALSAILDANITTFIAAMILFQMGSGPVRGFAVTLAIGIVTSVFTAFVLTRLIVATWLRYRRPKALPI